MSVLDFQILLMLYICDRTKLWNHSFINNATSWWSICQSITYVCIVLVNENLFLQICGNVIRTLILHICSKDRGITRITNTIRMVLVCTMYVLVVMCVFWKMSSCELFFMIMFVFMNNKWGWLLTNNIFVNDHQLLMTYISF